MRLAVHQPDIAGNLGTMLRLAACFGIAVDVIEPCGFPSRRALRRAGMDYAAMAQIVRHADFAAFRAALGGRLVLLTTAGAARLPDFSFLPGDTLLVGAEGAGVPDEVHRAADARVRIPLAPGLRSLNVAVAAGIGLAEALRQTEGFPE